jgi:basic amino acid/polyamine antiporter, APA family
MPKLIRALGLGSAVAIGMGAMVGAGLYVVSGLAVGIAGSSALLALLIVALAATCNALSSAQLAATFPASGGTYEFGYRLLGPWAGFSAGWTFLVSKLAAGGAVAIGLGAYIAPHLPLSSTAVGLVAVALLAGANLAGIRKAGMLNVGIVLLVLASLALFLVFGMPRIRPEAFADFAPEGAGGALRAAALLFFAFTGYARLATLAEEVQDPERTIPRAIGISIGAATVLYLAVIGTSFGILGRVEMGESAAPIAAAGEAAGGVWLGTVVTFGAAVALIGVLLSQILGISRMMLAMARRRDLPRALERVRPETGVPSAAVLATAAVIMAVAAFGGLGFAVESASFAILLYYAIANLCAIRLPAELRLYPPFVAWAGLIACVVLAGSLSWTTIASGLGVLAAGLAGRWIVVRRRPEP